MNHTPTPWRVGDAGHTVFGPPNGNPSPKVISPGIDKANAAFIVTACNAHEDLVKALKDIIELAPDPKKLPYAIKIDEIAKKALAKAGVK